MNYMQSGGFQTHPLMRLTLFLTLLLLSGFVLTNFFLYFAKMDLTPTSVATYYNGSEEEFRPPRSAVSMLEVTHGHLAMIALVLLVLTHLIIFAPFTKRTRIVFILIPFVFAILNEAAGWLVRFVSTDLAFLKVVGFSGFQGSLVVLLVLVARFLLRGSNGRGETEVVNAHQKNGYHVPSRKMQKGIEGSRDSAVEQERLQNTGTKVSSE